MLDIKRWDYMIKKLFFGFTLAELIVAMAIVASVAALTLPTLITNHQNKVMQISLQKAYRDLENNLEELYASNYRTGFYQSKLTSVSGIVDFLNNYYKVAQKCSATPQPCFAAKYVSLNALSTEVAFNCENGTSAQLKDNTAICIIPASPEVPAIPSSGGLLSQAGKDAVPATVYMDVNGSEPPNIGGRDMFMFQIDNYTIVDNANEASCLTSSVGEGCLKKIINDKWKIKY